MNVYEFLVNNTGKLEADTAEIVVRVIDNKDTKFYSPEGESTITLR